MVILPTPDKHVDDMSPTERYHFRNQQVAALVVALRHGETDVADVIADCCHEAAVEMLTVAVGQLADLVDVLSAAAGDQP